MEKSGLEVVITTVSIYHAYRFPKVILKAVSMLYMITGHILAVGDIDGFCGVSR